MNLKQFLAAGALASLIGLPCSACQAGGATQDEKKTTEKSSKQPKVVHGEGHRFGSINAPVKKKGRMRLAAFNLENLFDQVDDPSISGEYDDLPMATPDVRCKALAAAIRKLDADVLCVEEIESLDALKWFRDTYLKDLGYAHAASHEVGYYRGVEQGVLSRYPILSSEVFVDESLADVKREGEGWAEVEAGKGPTKFQRSPLKAVIEFPGGYKLTVFSVHLKASGGAVNEAQREAESLQLREWVAELLKTDPDANIAVLGDFNATPAQRAYALQVKGSKNGDGQGLLRAAYDFRDRSQKGDKEREAYTTHVSSRTIDYIVMSTGFADDCASESFFVLGTLYPGDEQQDRMRAWLKDRKGPEPEKPAGYASDHYPIAIDFEPVD